MAPSGLWLISTAPRGPGDTGRFFKEEKMSTMAQFLNKQEFAEMSTLSLATVNRLLKTGEIPSVHLGSRVLIPASFLESLERKAK
jgi:excisionase family DNA binding protein